MQDYFQSLILNDENDKEESIDINSALLNEECYFVDISEMSYEGKIILTNYFFYFTPKNPDQVYSKFSKTYFEISLFTIQYFKVSTKKFGRNLLKVILKDQKKLYFLIKNEQGTTNSKMYEDIVTLLNDIINQFNKSTHYSCAIDYRNRFRQKHKYISFNGWELYSIQNEFNRMKVDQNVYEISLVNNTYKLCDSYPKLIIIPKIKNSTLIKDAPRIRKNYRLPIMSFYYNKNGASLWRCSRYSSTSLISSKSCDIDYINKLANNKQFIIYDLRTKKEIAFNRFLGMGSEEKSNYKMCCDVVVMDLPNTKEIIKSIKKCFLAISLYISKNDSKDITTNDENFGKLVSNFIGSRWLEYSNNLIYASFDIADRIANNITCLVHDNDGTESAAQISTIVQIILDPFYRTIKGLCILIEKEWISFGHNFIIKNLIFNTEKNTRGSPIFIQFLDCLYQLTQMFPTAFEYNENLINFLSNKIFSCQYGTFLFNNMKENEMHKGTELMLSVWDEVMINKKKYFNPTYLNNDQPLSIKNEIFSMKIWDGYFYNFLKRDKNKNLGLAGEYSFNAISDMINVMEKNDLLKLIEDDNTKEFIKNFKSNLDI